MKIERQLTKFLAGGLVAVSIDWSVFLLLTNVLDLTNTVSKIISFISGMLFAFVFNGLITFTSHLSFQKLGRHIVVYFTSLCLNIVIFDFITWLNLSPKSFSTAAALVLATLASMSSNFLGMYFWVFSRKASIYE